MRLLQETEIMNLSGLGNFWTHTKLQDAEKMPEALIRNMCGNCFHPALIASALGSNETIRQWVDNAQHETHALVAGQHQALATYTELCGLIQKEINKDRKNKKKLEVVQDLPNYPIVEKSRPVKDLPKVAPATICGSRMPEITKIDQRKEHCIEAAILELDQKTCMLLTSMESGVTLMLSEHVFEPLSRFLTTAGSLLVMPLTSIVSQYSVRNYPTSLL